MRLSDWRDRTPHKDSMTPKVIAVIEPLLTAFASEPDPMCWVVWGDDPGSRYIVLVPTDTGLLQVHVRVLVPQEGPRASAKLTRWNRVQTGELAMEVAGGHRLMSFQVEGHVLRGSDADADAIVTFALVMFAAMDGRAPGTATAVAATSARPAAGPGSATKAARRPAGG
jgi:hypothetical protein